MNTLILCLIFIQVCIFFIAGFIVISTFMVTSRKAPVPVAQMVYPTVARKPQEALLTQSEIAYLWK